MRNFVDMVVVYSTSGGTDPFVLGGAVSGYDGTEALTSGGVYSYSAIAGDNFEYGIGTWIAESQTLTRSVTKSSYGFGALVPFPVGAVISFTLSAADLADIAASTQAAVAVDAAARSEAALATIEAILGTLQPATLYVATQDLPAEAFVNIFVTSGVPSVCLADANDPAKAAHGFVTAAVTSGHTTTVVNFGLNADTSLAFSGEAWLSATTPGACSATPLDGTDPSNAGKISQNLGLAIIGVGTLFSPQRPVEL